MNWLNILGTIVGVYIIFFVYSFYIAKDEDHGWKAAAVVLGFVTFVGCAILLAFLTEAQEFGGYKKYCEGELISLENNKSFSGEFFGGGSFMGSSYAGKMGGATACSFAVSWPNGDITIITENVNMVVFHPSKESRLSVQKVCREFWYPYRLKGAEQKYWQLNNYMWHVWIPENSVQKYVKFN